MRAAALLLALLLAADARAAGCPVKAITEAIRSLPSRYLNFPPRLQKTLELRDVFSPMLRRLDEATARLDRDRIAAGIRKFEADNTLVRGSFDKGITEVERLTPAQRELLPRMEGQTRYRAPSAEGAKGFEKFKEFVTAVPREHSAEWEDLKHASIGPAVLESVNPVGEYGPELSKSMQVTQAILRDELYKAFRKDAADIFAGDKDLLLKHTKRGHLDQELGPITAAIEGITSLNQAVSALLANKIHGVSTYRDALRLLVLPGKGEANGLLAEFAGRLSVTFEGPPGFSAGRYFENPILNDTRGTRMAPALLEALKELRKIHHGKVDPENLSQATGLATGCPVFHTKGSSDEKSGMQHAFEAYLRVFEQVDDQRLATAQR